jgi:branched-chain amino acid transport system substrate-binding protein
MTVVLLWLSYLLLTHAGWQSAPYLDFNKAGAGFYGDGRSLPEPSGLTTVRIGILGPARTNEGLHQRTAVQIALDAANLNGGYRRPRRTGERTAPDLNAGPEAQGIPYEAVFREDDGPWGVAARQVVQLAYEDKVWAIIGGLDGLHTHVAELVVSKAWVPVISPSAIDSTISYANVPWVFRVAPADSRQASSLLSLAEKRGYQHLVVLSEIDREAHAGWLRLNECAGRRHAPIEMHLEYQGTSPEDVIPRLASVPMDALILWGKPQPALGLLLALRKAGIAVPVLGSSDLATSEFAQNGPLLDDVTVSSLCDLARTDADFVSFCREFQLRTGQIPSAVALYSYDVARLVIAAIERAGLNRALIRDRLGETAFAGLTGKISFNMLGGNDAEPVLMHLQRSRWARLE